MYTEERKISITSVAHRIGTHTVVSTVTLKDSTFEIQALNHRTYQSWTTSLSLFHVAAIFAKESFTSGCKGFWDSIGRAIELHEIDGEDIDEATELPIKISVVCAETQHIRSFPVVHNSSGRNSFLLHQVRII